MNGENLMFMNNKIIKNCKNMNATSFYVYICLKFYTVKNETTKFAVNDVLDDIGLAKNTLNRSLKVLVNEGLLKEGSSYNSPTHPNKEYTFIEPSNTILGYTKISLGFMGCLINKVKNKELTKRQFEMFIYLIHRKSDNSKDFKLSQSQISQNLGVTRNAISISLKKLSIQSIFEIQEQFPAEFKNVFHFLTYNNKLVS